MTDVKILIPGAQELGDGSPLHERFHSGENALRLRRIGKPISPSQTKGIATLLKQFQPTIVGAKTDRNLSPLVGILGRKNRRAELESVSQRRSSALLPVHSAAKQSRLTARGFQISPFHSTRKHAVFQNMCVPPKARRLTKIILAMQTKKLRQK